MTSYNLELPTTDDLSIYVSPAVSGRDRTSVAKETNFAAGWMCREEQFYIPSDGEERNDLALLLFRVGPSRREGWQSPLGMDCISMEKKEVE